MANTPKRYFERYFTYVGIACVFAVFSFVLWADHNRKVGIAEKQVTARFKEINRYKEPRKLPSIKVATPDGGIMDLSKKTGENTVLNIWATWCTPCIKELPSLQKLSNALPYGSEWRVIAVSIDMPQNLEKVVKFTQRYKATEVASYHDYNMDLQKQLNVEKLPMTLIISKSGHILYEIYGDAVWHDAEVISFLKTVAKAQ